MSRVFAIILSSLLLFLTSCSSCQKNSTQTEPIKKSITIGIAQEPDTLFIPFREMMAAEEIIRSGNSTLTCFDANWNLIAWAAKEIPTLQNGLLELYEENGKKKMKTTWHLKDSFFWPDGTPLTADDFIFTLKLYKDPNQEILSRIVSDKVEKMESRGDDKRTLVVFWSEPYAYYHNYQQHEALPKHLVEPIYNRSPDKLKQSIFSQQPAFAGAFTVKEWVVGSHVVAERNPHIKGPFVPKLDEIIWRIIPQTNTLESNLVSGTIDAISSPGLSLEQALNFEKRYKDQFNFYYTQGLVWEHADFNLDNEIFKDVRVRQALAYASDREGIAQNLFEGKQPVAHGTEPPRSPYYNTDIKKYAYDPTKAARLLDEAGWKMGANGIREKEGKPLAFSIMTTSGNKTREQVQQLLQSQWKQIGVDVEIKNQPAKVFFGETMRKRKFEGMAMYAWIKDPVQISDTLWRCDYIPSSSNNFQGQNMPGWCDKEVDSLIKRASSELDNEKRYAIGKKIESIFAEQVPAIPLFFLMEISVTKKGFNNWKPTGTLQPTTWNAQEWYWN